jgi:DNA-binding PadR family transcriptional regulator
MVRPTKFEYKRRRELILQALDVKSDSVPNLEKRINIFHQSIYLHLRKLIKDGKVTSQIERHDGKLIEVFYLIVDKMTKNMNKTKLKAWNRSLTIRK